MLWAPVHNNHCLQPDEQYSGFTDLVITEFISTYLKLDINWGKKKK